MLGLFLTNSIFIGERDRQNRIERAARALPPKPSKKQIQEAAGKAGPGVSTADIARRRGQLDKPPEQKISTGERRTVVQISRTTPEGEPIFRAATPEERRAVSEPITQRRLQQMKAEETLKRTRETASKIRQQETTEKIKKKAEEDKRRAAIKEVTKKRTIDIRPESKPFVGPPAPIPPGIAPAPKPRQETQPVETKFEFIEKQKEEARVKELRRPTEIRAEPKDESKIQLIAAARRRLAETQFQAEERTGERFKAEVAKFAGAALRPIDTTEEIVAAGTNLLIGAGIGVATAVFPPSGLATAALLGTGAVVLTAEGVAIASIPDPQERQEAIERALFQTAVGVGGFGAGRAAGTALRGGVGRKVVTVTQPKSKKVTLKEAVDVEEAVATQRVLTDVVQRQRVQETKVKPFERRVTAPKDFLERVEFLEREDITAGIRLGEKGPEPAFFQEVPAKTRTFKQIEPQAFEIEGKGVVAAQFKGQARADSPITVKRLIDPNEFKVKVKGDKATLTKKQTKGLPGEVEPGELQKLAIRAEGEVTSVLETFRQQIPADVAGLNLPLPAQQITTLGGRLRGLPILETRVPPGSLTSFLISQSLTRTTQEIESRRISKPLIEVSQERPDALKPLPPEVDFFKIIDTEERELTGPKGLLDTEITPAEKAREGIREIDTFDSLPIPSPQTPSKELVSVGEPIITDPVIDFERKVVPEEVPIIRTDEDQDDDVPPPPPIIKEETKTKPRIIGVPKLKKKKEKIEAYNAQVKEEGKFRTVNKEPLTKSDALSVAARITDNTIAARFRVKKIKEPKTKPVPRGDNYFSANRQKFRDFTINRKGKKTGSLPPNEFIELREHRLDKAGERMQIARARAMKGAMV